MRRDQEGRWGLAGLCISVRNSEHEALVAAMELRQRHVDVYSIKPSIEPPYQLNLFVPNRVFWIVRHG